MTDFQKGQTNVTTRIPKRFSETLADIRNGGRHLPDELHMAVVPTQECEICGDPFTPKARARGRWSKTCGRWSCRSELGARSERWKASLVKAAVTKKRKQAERVAAVTDRRFGELSERDRAIFLFANVEGYRRGYNAGYKATGKARLSA